jgi:hypothetical protein
MFTDDINNRYTYLNTLNNVVWEEPADRTPNPNRVICIHQEMEPVLSHLMRARPTWRFKSTERFSSGDGPVRALNFTIFDGDEALGQLYMEHHWRDSTVRYYFDNFRLSNARQKNQKNFSSKPDVAAKRIIKAFHLKTPKERASEAFSDVRTVAQNAVNEANWPLRRAKSVIEKEMFAYLERNWEDIKPSLGANVAEIDLPALVHADREAAALSSAISDGLGVVVRIEANATYMVARAESGSYNVETFTDSTLPDHLRGSLGLLKLMEDKQHIEGVGARANRNLYFVMDKKETSNV